MENIGTELPYSQRAYDGLRRLRDLGLRRVRLHDRLVSLTSYYAAYEANGGRSFDITIHHAEVEDVMRVMVGKPCGIVKLKHTSGMNDGQTFSVEDLRNVTIRFIER